MPELLSPLWLLGLIGLGAYVLGSIPFGLVVTRAMGLGDVRQIGSGNIGATNVMRTGNKLAGALTLLLDAGKGVIAVLIARFAVGEDAAQVAALTAFLGHLYPVFLGFRGGKGVATYLGVLLALAWPVGLLTCATWLVAFRLCRYSSLSALIAIGLSSIFAGFMGYMPMVAVLVVMKVLVFIRHKDNIRRLIARTEPRSPRKKPKG